jgi:hypothetical protein
MLTGLLPSALPAPPSAANPDLDAAWDEFLLRAIDPDPRRRFESAEQMRCPGTSRTTLAGTTRADLPAGAATRPGPGPGPSVAAAHPCPHRPARARTDFGVDRLWRPAPIVVNDLAPAGPGALHDRATGLIWQQSGSPYGQGDDRPQHADVEDDRLADLFHHLLVHRQLRCGRPPCAGS